MNIIVEHCGRALTDHDSHGEVRYSFRRSCKAWNFESLFSTMSSRKRPLEVDANGFGPIAKKLHKLHIDPLIHVIPVSNTQSDQSTDNGHTRLVHALATSQSFNHLNSRETLGDELLYNPVLGIKQNPIYYEANRLLFEAHQLRVTRHFPQTPQPSERRRSTN